MTQRLFIRNDDVRSTLDDSLVELTEIVLDAGFSITHAVEPANISEGVAAWLLQQHASHPGRVEIVQHGYDHRPRHYERGRPGEFGGQRGQAEQMDDLQRGRSLMDRHFGTAWFPALTFPFGAYNEDTLRAAEQCGFKVISTGSNDRWRRRLLNRAGRLLRRKRLWGRNVVYECSPVPGYRLIEIPIIFNHTKRYIPPDSGEQKTAQELQQEWQRCSRRRNVVGLLTHHRFETRQDLVHMRDYLRFCERSDVKGITLESLYVETLDRYQRH